MNFFYLIILGITLHFIFREKIALYSLPKVNIFTMLVAFKTIEYLNRGNVKLFRSILKI